MSKIQESVVIRLVIIGSILELYPRFKKKKEQIGRKCHNRMVTVVDLPEQKDQ